MNRYPPSISGTFKALCKRFAIVALLSLLMATTPLLSTKLYAQETTHVVAAGETLSAIAAQYNVSVSTLMSYNNIRNADLIKVGQIIRIPSVVQPRSTPTPTGSEEVATPTTERRANPNLTPESTSPGAGRPIPTATPITSSPAPVSGYTAQGEPVYTVRRGDTLYGIALRFGVTVSAIMQRNGLRSQVIAVSQRLIIPRPEARSVPLYSPQVTGPDNGSPTLRPTATPTTNSGSGIYLLPTVEATPTPVIGTKLR